MFVKENIYIQSLKKTNLAKNIQDKTILYGLQGQYFSVVVFLLKPKFMTDPIMNNDIFGRILFSLSFHHADFQARAV